MDGSREGDHCRDFMHVKKSFYMRTQDLYYVDTITRFWHGRSPHLGVSTQPRGHLHLTPNNRSYDSSVGIHVYIGAIREDFTVQGLALAARVVQTSNICGEDKKRLPASVPLIYIEIMVPFWKRGPPLI
jgi:hypothetical protein